MKAIPTFLSQLQNQIQTVVSEEMRKAQIAIDRRILGLFGGDTPQPSKPVRARPRTNKAKAKPAEKTPKPTRKNGRLTKAERSKGRRLVVQFARERGKLRTPDLKKINFFKKLSDNQIRNVVFGLVDSGVLKQKGERRQREYFYNEKSSSANAA